ncbi:hypothetical protein [Mucilaginibacter segetis]|uniref:Lipoprotein n=1 Tax=Mucilaginibacter segetis TaxID=2793071 RepID=A0A934UNP9_9SPHI|nr:hypothetical protein [Mucilaginibacter segetis]MBK0380137.1 hypothetical protein [Mucilaginibacter segetis]
MRKLFYVFIILIFSACGTVQSIIKSSFPYTATLTIPASAEPGKMLTAISTGNSFDQNFTKDGNNSSRISEVHIVSAKMQSTLPADFNIGNLSSAKIYMAKENGEGEVLVASRTDIGPNSGNSIVLDIDNTHFLDELVREPSVRIRMVYQLRNKINADASLRVALSITANPSPRN